MPTLSGTIYHSRTKERIPGALVKATSGEKQYELQNADDNGNFRFDLTSGQWSVIAFDNDSFPSDLKSVDLMEDKSDFDIYLARLAGENDAKRGRAFFWVLVGLLIALLIIYVIAHIFLPSGKPGSFQFWLDYPLRYVEILLWGLGGILVNKLIMVSWWIRNQRFYREGILMHISHLLVTPLMVLVVALLLSLVGFNITLADNSLTLDLAKPELLISFSFILGTIPWSLWSLIENTGRRFAEGKEKQ
ncbi:MAG: hypothetical protein ACM3H7_01565 [Acidobacteriaceae bacterium]